ncbi:MAG: tRNA uridine-5-carboxymethylaminomethyl(34) synthesis GTPase MnmE [Alphaproteobacteria bacterium]
MTKTNEKRNTIFALASGRGRAGVAVVRLSGPGAGMALKSLTGRALPEPKMANLAKLKSPESEEIIDKCIILWFPGPESFTGEDVVELHVHGSPAIINKLSDVLSDLGLRPAEPGEFTRRAFENGKMDLTQAEGLHDLVLAETEAQRKQALYQLGGGLSEIYSVWRDQLVSCLADIEATIDFSDEEIPGGLMKKVETGVETLKSGIENILGDFERGQAIRRGFKIVLLGPTNVGKSSLLNALAREEKAIVSDIPGTTRDAIEVHMDLAGYSVVLVDTAGLREAGDTIEEEGIRRALGHAREANLKLLLSEASAWPELSKELENQLGADAIVVLTKADKVSDKSSVIKGRSGIESILISSENGQGLDELIKKLEARVVRALEASAPAGLTRVRHKQALGEALEALIRFLGHDLAKTDPAILAEDLRLASRAMASITGEVGVEEILGKIFSQFCIGK